MSKNEIDSTLEFVGIEKIKILNGEVEKNDTRVKLDFSAIAKGLGVDLVAEYLSTKGIENYFVEIGGEIVSQGVNQKGNPWTIGVSKPSYDGGKAIEVCLQSEKK